MKTHKTLRLSTSAAATLVATAAMTASTLLWAADRQDAAVGETLTVTITAGAYRKDADKTSASALAPTQASLEATQPQSVITREFIEKSVAPTAEYSRIVNIAPSMSGDSANGPGLSETKTTMRGFSDDQYNITFDGIPWGDTNNPAHHSTSFFPASTIGGVVVERGPGNASNLGFATFGGSINLFSKKPKDESGYSLFGAVGTWNTTLLGMAYESGKMADMGGATVQLNVQHLQSDGYLTLNKINSDNLTFKFTRPWGDSTMLTAFASVNRIRYVQPDNNKGPTAAQVAQFGKNYSLNNDPASFNFAGYNHTAKATDFEYMRVQTAWSSKLSTEAQVYSYFYDNQTISSTDPTGSTAPGTKVGVAGNKNIPGIDKQNQYRVNGGIFKGTLQTDVGLLRAGVWLEKSNTDRHQYDLDLTLGNIRDPRETKPTPVQFPSVLFDQQSRITTAQPFAEFEWEVANGATVTPGIKAVNIKRSVSAVVNQTTRLPQDASVTYKTTMPFLTVNKQWGQDFAVYGQYAKGFQIPDLKSFYIADPTRNSAEPQLSTNYQLGLIGKSAAMAWDLDVYQIDFKNKYVSNNLGGTAAAYINIGGARYKGVEGQLTYALGGGLAAYVNGSLNHATANDTGKTIPNAPAMTGAVGALFSSGPWSSSLLVKRTGASYQTEFDATKPALYDQYRIRATTNTDLGVSYTFAYPGLGAKALKLQVNIFNLFNKQDPTAISAGKLPAGDQTIYQAPRSLQISAKADF